MPSDITGTEILDEEQGSRRLRFVKGPIFAQIILADEINRTPPKTQAALLEAMQEHHVTAAGRTYPLDEPFFVLATQNPIELEGTYPLPEAQLDRFMFNIVISYLSEDDEVAVVTQTTGATAREAGARAERPGHPAVPGARGAGRDRRGSGALRGAAGRCVAARPAGRARLRREVGEVGRRPARVAGARARRQGARADARPLSRVDQGHSGAGQADSPPPRHDELLRRVRAHQLRHDRRAAARDRAAARRAGCSRCLQRARTPVSRSGGRRAPRHARAEGPHDRRRLSLRPAPQPLQGLQRRVRRVPAVHARRRSVDDRLEGLRAQRSALRQEVRGGNQPQLPHDARHQRIDGLRLARHHEVRVRPVPGGVARLSDEPAARRRRPDRVRRPHRDDAAGERAARPSARAARDARSAAARHARPTSRSRCTSWPTR